MNLGLTLTATALALSAAVCGVLLVRTTARLSGTLLLTGAGTLATAIALGADHGGALAVALATASGSIWGAAVLGYPSPDVRHPIDYCAWIVALSAGVAATAAPLSQSVRTTALLAIPLAVVFHLLWRYDRADETERVPLLWMCLAIGTTAIAYGLAAFLSPRIASPFGLTAAALVPPVFVLGVRRPVVVDVRALVVTALVFLVAVFSYVSLFIGITATFESFGVDDLPVGVLGVIGAIAAAGFHPLRVRLRGVIDELLFGERPDPLAAVTRVAARIGDDPALALTDIREALVLPYVGLCVDGHEITSSGTPVHHTRRFPLALGDGTESEMVVGLRSGDLDLSAGDERVLRIVTPLLVQTMRAHSLAAEVSASRGQAIAAIEDERRRLRRDLHDGLGPTLSGIAFTADAARNSLADAPAADELLRSLRADAVTAIGEIRRLVYGMRPPALDELGLVPALRQWTLTLRDPDGAPFAVALDAGDDLSGLPAAIEVAAYRIAVEAITNAARHSGSNRAEARLRRSDARLTIHVRDHGAPNVGAPWTAGVGIASMRERAAEVGGTLTVEATAGGGIVTAVLPVA